MNEYPTPEALMRLSKAQLATMVLETAAVGTRIRSPSDLDRALAPWRYADQEHALLITLNGANEIIRTHVISIGVLNRTLVHPREVFRQAILDKAASVIFAHNHPSGHIAPSSDDREVNRRLSRAGAILGIPLLDSIIIAADGTYSFAANGELPQEATE